MTPSYDPTEATAVLAGADPTLGRLIARVGPCPLAARPMESPFEALMRSIIYQQLSGKAAATIYGRVEALLPPSRPPQPEDVLALPAEALRAAGVSRAKVAAVHDLAARTLDGTVPPLADLEALPDEAIVERLVRVRGIGPWTAEMMLIFWMGRPDVLPVTDLGVRKGFMRTYDLEALPEPAWLRAYGDRWRPYRSVASWYLWRAVDTP
jgi:DNA-3-methyladenine glycosylase II